MPEIVKRKPANFIEILDTHLEDPTLVLKKRTDLLLQEKEHAAKETARLAKEQGVQEGVLQAEAEYQSKTASTIKALTAKNAVVIQEMSEALAISKKEYVKTCVQTLFEITDLLIEKYADLKNKEEFIGMLSKAFEANDTRRFIVSLRPEELTEIRNQFPLRLGEVCGFQEDRDLEEGVFSATFEGGGVIADGAELKKTLLDIFSHYITMRFPENSTQEAPVSQTKPESATPAVQPETPVTEDEIGSEPPKKSDMNL